MLKEKLMSRTFVRALGVACALATLSSMAHAQDLNTVLTNYYKARGGLDKIKAVNSVKMTGTFSMGEMQAPFTFIGARPNKLHIEFTAMGMTGMQGYDGTTAWMLMPFMGQKNAEPMPPDQSKEIQNQADIDGPLVDWEAKGNKLELLGKESVDGTDAYKIKVTLKSGDVRTIYLDAEAFLEIKEVATMNMRGKDVTASTSFSDYKEVNGVLYPFTTENSAEGAPGSQKMIAEKIETNIDVSTVQFSMPAKAEGDGGGTPSTGGPAGDVVKDAGKAPDAAADKAKADAKAPAKKK